MGLFKYFSADRIGILNTLQIRYSQPASLNDPFEARPFYKGFASEEQMAQGYAGRFQRVLLEQYASMGDAFRSSVLFSVSSVEMEHMRQEIYETFRIVDSSFTQSINETMHDAFSKKIGLLSLSEIRDNQLMWSHYAQSHTGFVIEFDDTHSYFAARHADSDNIWQLHKVHYMAERPQTTVIQLDFRAILLGKHESWSYEREWRDFRPLNQASTTLDFSPFSIHLFDIPSQCVRSVIFGARMAKSIREKALDVIKSNRQLTHLQILDASLDERRYGIVFRPVASG